MGDMGYGIWDLGYVIWDMGYGIWDLGYGIWDVGCGMWDVGYGIWDMGYGIWDMGYGIWDMGYGINKETDVTYLRFAGFFILKLLTNPNYMIPHLHLQMMMLARCKVRGRLIVCSLC